MPRRGRGYYWCVGFDDGSARYYWDEQTVSRAEYLRVPITLALWFPYEYPLVSVGAVVGFIGGALLAAWITGCFNSG
jgi:hypothetical protein